MAEKGRLMILELEDSPGSLTYTQIAGGRAKNINIGNPTTDVSTDQSAGQWQERDTGYALKSMSFDYSGLFESHATQKRIVAAVIAGTNKLNMRATVPGLGTFVGPFSWEGVQLAGNHDSELSFSGSYQSAGEIDYTPS
jgi:TP901-1 family phage major tail protein